MPHNVTHLLISFLASATFVQSPLSADGQPTNTSTTPLANPIPSVKVPSFTPFTGKVIKNKVRVRTQPTLDDNVFREMNRDDLVVVVGEIDGFYTIQSPRDLRAYIFRTFVLDDVVEGSHVNVRLKPDLDAPVVGQLNSGDRVKGTVCPTNSKWLEITMPESSHFYIAKEYVEKIGDTGMLAKIEKRQDEVNALLDEAYKESQNELQKPFEQINIQSATVILQKIVQQYSDFPTQTAKAKELLTQLQDTFLQKKIAYLESSSQQTSEQWHERHEQLINELKGQQERLAQLEQQLQQEKITSATKEEQGREKERQAALQIQKTTLEAAQQAKKAALEAAQKAQETALEAARLAREAAIKEAYDAQTAAIANKMVVWNNIENTLYENWKSEKNSLAPIESFYSEQQESAVTLKGLLEPYNRPVSNKPGDFLLVSQSDNLPIAYLYSTQINLHDKVGQVVTVKAISRPNHHFAFPAYYVLTAE